MTTEFPSLDDPGVSVTRDAMHAYSKILGDWLKACRAPRKHWWHTSLRPSLLGLTTGVVHADTSFELELDLRSDALRCSTVGSRADIPLNGRPPAELAQEIERFLASAGLDDRAVPPNRDHGSEGFPGYASEQAGKLAGALNACSAALTTFRAGVREETSPIQLWPHHFDLAMLWLPGDKIPDKDPDDEENADKQMNFGFTFGDQSIPEAYFYVTAYPLPDAFNGLEMPVGTEWRTEGFTGAVTRYRTLQQLEDPQGYLLSLWKRLLAAGRAHLMKN